TRRGRSEIAQSLQRVAAVEMSLGISRLQLRGARELFRRLPNPRQRQQDEAKTVSQRGGARRELDGAMEKLQCLVMFSALIQQQSKQVQRIETPRMLGDDPPIDRLGLRQSPGAVMLGGGVDLLQMGRCHNLCRVRSRG